MSGIGFDCGTYNLICCKRDDEQNFDYESGVNAFLEFPMDNGFVFNMMEKSGVPLIHREDVNVAYALGDAAVKMAYTMPQIELKRPMKDGCVNPKERDAFQIMKSMIHDILGEINNDKEMLIYSVPANAVNVETDADYHRKILEAIFNAYESKEGYKVDARPINEGMALVYAELADKMYTGIGISCGAGMVNVAFSLFGTEVFSFSLVNSGDWIDKQAAKATGETIAYINREKTKIDLGKEPSNLTERAIKTQYELMIEKTIGGIKKGLEDNSDKKARLEDPIDIIVAGGTSSPPGFDKFFEKMIRNSGVPIDIGNVIRPNDPVKSVAKGCLIAAENAG